MEIQYYSLERVQFSITHVRNCPMGATHTKYSFDAEYIFAQHSSQISCADLEGGQVVLTPTPS